MPPIPVCIDLSGDDLVDLCANNMAQLHQEIADGEGAARAPPRSACRGSAPSVSPVFNYHKLLSTDHLDLPLLPAFKYGRSGGPIFCACIENMVPTGAAKHLILANPGQFAEQDAIFFDKRRRQDPITSRTAPEWAGDGMAVLEKFLQKEMKLLDYNLFRLFLISNQVSALPQQLRCPNSCCLTPAAWHLCRCPNSCCLAPVTPGLRRRFHQGPGSGRRQTLCRYLRW